MTISKLNAAINSPLRMLTDEDTSKIKKDLSLLVSNSSFKNLWVDCSGHIHQKVEIVNLMTLLSAMVDRLHELVSGIHFKDQDQAEYLVAKSKEILDQYIPLIMSQEKLFAGNNPEKIARLHLLQVNLNELKGKVTENKVDFIQKIFGIRQVIDKLLAENYLDGVMKTSKFCSSYFETGSIQQKFLRFTTDQLTTSHLTQNHLDMIARVVSTATDEMKGEIVLHAAKHLCAFEKLSSNEKLILPLLHAQRDLGQDVMIQAAKEFKIIPSALVNDPKAIATLLSQVYGQADFAKEIGAWLEKMDGGTEAIAQLIEKESHHLNNPELQNKYITRILFLEQVFPKSAQIEFVFQDLEQLAIYGDLPSSCVQQLLPRGGIIRKLCSTFGQTLQMEPQERVKIIKEVLPIAINLYAKSGNKEISDLIDELCSKLFEISSSQDAESVINSAMADAMYEENIDKLEKILSAVLVAASSSQNKGSLSFFRKVFSTILQTKNSHEIIHRAIDAQVKILNVDELAIGSLTLLQIALIENHLTNQADAMRSKIHTALSNRSKILVQENLDGKFAALFSELLTFETGMEDLEKLIHDKIHKLGREYRTADARDAAKNYLSAFKVGIDQRLQKKASVRLKDLSDIIAQALDVANIGQGIFRTKRPCMNKAIVQDLDRKVLDQQLALYLYNKDGSLAQEPF